MSELLDWLPYLGLALVLLVSMVIAFDQKRKGKAYRAAIESCRLPEEPPVKRISETKFWLIALSPTITLLLVFVCFKFEYLPLLFSIAFALILFGLFHSVRAHRSMQQVWSEYAHRYQMKFTPAKFKNGQSLTIEGNHLSAYVILRTVEVPRKDWQYDDFDDNLSRSTQMLEVATPVQTRTRFDIEDIGGMPEESELPQFVLEMDSFREKMRVLELERMTLENGELSYITPKIPNSFPELRFNIKFITKLAAEFKS